MAGFLEAAVNRLLATDANSVDRFKRLDGKLLQVDLGELPAFVDEAHLAKKHHRVSRWYGVERIAL